MSQVNTYRCNGDGCNKTRDRDTNHWKIIMLLNHQSDGTSQFMCSEWDDSRATLPNTYHVCGGDCAQGMFQRWLHGELRK